MAQYGPEIIGGLLAEYAGQVESWKVEHDRAMRCRDVEGSVVLGITLAIAIDQVDMNWRAEVHSGSADYAQADADEIDRLYSGWLAVSDRVIEAIVAAESAGHSVKWAAEFRSAWNETRGAVTPDDRFFNMDHPAMAELRDKAIADHAAGLTVS